MTFANTTTTNAYPIAIETERKYSLSEVLCAALGVVLLIGFIVLLVYLAKLHVDKGKIKENHIECLKKTHVRWMFFAQGATAFSKIDTCQKSSCHASACMVENRDIDDSTLNVTTRLSYCNSYQEKCAQSLPSCFALESDPCEANLKAVKAIECAALLDKNAWRQLYGENPLMKDCLFQRLCFPAFDKPEPNYCEWQNTTQNSEEMKKWQQHSTESKTKYRGLDENSSLFINSTDGPLVYFSFFSMEQRTQVELTLCKEKGSACTMFLQWPYFGFYVTSRSGIPFQDCDTPSFSNDTKNIDICQIGKWQLINQIGKVDVEVRNSEITIADKKCRINLKFKAYSQMNCHLSWNTIFLVNNHNGSDTIRETRKMQIGLNTTSLDDYKKLWELYPGQTWFNQEIASNTTFAFNFLGKDTAGGGQSVFNNSQCNGTCEEMYKRAWRNASPDKLDKYDSDAYIELYQTYGISNTTTMKIELEVFAGQILGVDHLVITCPHLSYNTPIYRAYKSAKWDADQDLMMNWKTPCNSTIDCNAHGNCNGTTQTFYCACFNGYSGNNCQNVDNNVAACDRTNCNNRGECAGTKNNIQRCTCDANFSGDRCQDENCDSAKVCNGHGTCTGTVNNWKCACNEGYSKKDCRKVDTKKAACDRSDCNNQGNCSGNKKDPRCTCDAGWKGDKCNQETCNFATQCNNQASSCNGDRNNPKCNCNAGYSGDKCQTTDPNVVDCDREDCSQHGNCSGKKSALVCVCDVGRAGTHCEKSVCAPATSCNNQGTCAGTGEWDCICNVGWCGQNCSVSCINNTTTNGINTNYNNGTFLNNSTYLTAPNVNNNTNSHIYIYYNKPQSLVHQELDCHRLGPLDLFLAALIAKIGYRGRRCNKRTDGDGDSSDWSSNNVQTNQNSNSAPCSTADCNYNGLCIGTKDSFVCTCINGYSGNRCMVSSVGSNTGTNTAITTTCLASQNGQVCSGNGICGQTINNCICYIGWTGTNCEFKTNAFDQARTNNANTVNSNTATGNTAANGYPSQTNWNTSPTNVNTGTNTYIPGIASVNTYNPGATNSNTGGTNLLGGLIKSRIPGRSTSSAYPDPHQPKWDDQRKMHCLVWNGKCNVDYVEHARPCITEPKDVLLKVTATTICGSDLHLYKGTFKGMRAGDIIGHEFMGIIEEVGSQVETLKVGQRVIVGFSIACGQCDYCKREEYTACDMTNPCGTVEKLYGDRPSGFYGYSHLTGGFPGGQAEYVRVAFADVNCLPIPDDIPDEKALYLTDVIPTAYHGVVMGEVGKDSVVGIWGLGPIGLMCARWCQIVGARRVIGIDTVPERLLLAKNQLGIDIIDFREEKDVVGALRRLAGGPLDVAIECAGFDYVQCWFHKLQQTIGLETDTSEIFDQMIRAVRKFVGAMMEKGLTIRGGQAPAQKYWRLCIEKIKSGELDPSFLVTHFGTLADGPKFFKMMNEKEGGCIKVFMRPESA
uniref:EGF-like domain-containing protein n=1 Tax=Ditylenchus dipsaci TaxID=166011 RepID=A0A915DN93_9BILA